MIYIINNIFQKHCVILYNNTRSLSLILNNFPNNSQTNKELEAQKSLALQKLETQIDELSQLIKEKLLGKQVVL